MNRAPRALNPLLRAPLVQTLLAEILTARLPRPSTGGGVLLSLALLAGVPHGVAAQSLVARGDALLRAGRIAAAESLYYDAAVHAPRDPAARLALGRYLAARGALRVGAVLLEEARVFGADSAVVAREIAPVYARLADYDALAALPRSPLSAPERERAAWLRDHPPVVPGADSVTVAFVPATGGAAIGTFQAVLGADTVTVAVDAGISGWVLDAVPGSATSTRLFGRGPVVVGRSVAVADVRIGALSLGHVPVRFGREGGQTNPRAAPRRDAIAVRVGLDVLGAFAPTFDADAGVLTLRGDGRVRRTVGERVPALLLSDGVYVPAGGSLASFASARGRGVVPGRRRWTYDRRRGEIVVER